MVYEKEKADALEQKLIAAYGEGSRVPIMKLRENEDPDIREIAQFVYENVFLKYTMKQWGQKPEDISPEVTGRVPVLVSYDNRYFQDKYQGVPKEGFTPMFERMLDHENITVETGVDCKERLRFEENQIYFDGTPFDGIAKKLPGGWKNRGGSELNNLDAQGISSKSAKGSDTFKQNGNLPNGVRTEISGSDLRHSNGFEGFDVINASSKQKGNFGEFKADDNLVNNQGLKDAGYDLKSVGRNAPSCPDDKIVKGIDGLYENLNQNSNVEYIIDEAKFGKAQLGKTDDGKQMSDDWLLGSVTGNNRILDAVDGDEELAYKIMEALKKGQVERVLSKVDADGNVVTYRLDSQGNIIGIWP